MSSRLVKSLNEEFPKIEDMGIFIKNVTGAGMRVNYDLKTNLFVFRSVTGSTLVESPDSLCNGLILEKHEKDWEIRCIRQRRIIYVDSKPDVEVKIYELQDGPVISLYNFNGEWRLSSKTGISIGKNIWHKLTYDEILAEILKSKKIDPATFFSKLDKTKSYTVCLRHPEITPLSDEMRLVLLDCWDLKTAKQTETPELAEFKLETMKETTDDAEPQFGKLYVGKKYNYIKKSWHFDSIRNHYYNVKSSIIVERGKSIHDRILLRQYENSSRMTELLPGTKKFYENLDAKVKKTIKEVLDLCQIKSKKEEFDKLLQQVHPASVIVFNAIDNDLGKKDIIIKSAAYLTDPENYLVLEKLI